MLLRVVSDFSHTNLGWALLMVMEVPVNRV